MIKYLTKSASENDLFSHLSECRDNFIPPLNETVNIKEYSQKLFLKSITFEAWIDNALIGCIAAYFNDETNKLAYITNVSVLMDYMGLGIASELLNMCVEYAKKNNVTELSLEVNLNNSSAIFLYNKFNFKKYGKKGDMLLMRLRLKN